MPCVAVIRIFGPVRPVDSVTTLGARHDRPRMGVKLGSRGSQFHDATLAVVVIVGRPDPQDSMVAKRAGRMKQQG